MLTPAELQTLRQPNGLKAVLAVGFDWLVIIGLFALAIIIPHPITYIFVFILMARQQYALLILMHDASHHRLFQSAKFNDFVGQLFCSSPVFFSLHSYRTLHMKHHQQPLTKNDPDIVISGGYPTTRKSFLRKLLRDLLGLSYFKLMFYFLAYRPHRVEEEQTEVFDKLKQYKIPISQRLVWSFVLNGILFGVLFYLGHPWLYLFFWVLPMISILQVFLRIRAITEHAGYEAHANQMLCTRTVLNPLQAFFFAPHQVYYHMEHHAYPVVPWFNLKKVHQLLKHRGSLPEQNVFKSYGDVIGQLVH